MFELTPPSASGPGSGPWSGPSGSLPGRSLSEVAAMGFLVRYTGNTRKVYTVYLRGFFQWCADARIEPIEATRVQLELYVRAEQERGLQASSVRTRMYAVKGMFKFAAIDGLIPVDPAQYVRLPPLFRDERRTLGLDRGELNAFLAAAAGVSLQHHALAVLLGVQGLRVSEACSIQVGDFDRVERGHRVIRFLGKGGKPARMPMPPMVVEVLDRARGSRTSGPLLVRKKDGLQLDRHNARSMVTTIAKRAGIAKPVHPHMLRAAFVTIMLDAGVALRDVQIAARHADPRTTTGYDRNRDDLDRHGVHRLAAYLSEEDDKE